MSADSLIRLEKNAFSVFYRDGSFELFFGLLLLAGVLRDLLPHTGAAVLTAQIVSIGLILTAAALFTLQKKYLTAPRLGYVSFSKRRKARVQRLHVILFLVVVAANIGLYLLLEGGAGGGGTGTPNYAASALVTLLIFTAISLVGFFLDYSRLYAVAVLFAATEPAHIYVQYHTSLRPVGVFVNTLPALVLILIGLASLRRFLHTYPSGGEEVAHG
ncbi:hypothetical protein JXO52_00680 [bacterium]|nr:hypothetical protein [bacterium]